MSDDDIDYGKYRLLMFFGAAFVFLGVFCLFDLLFVTFGSEGTAVVSEVYTSPSRRRSDRMVVEFKFKDPAGNERIGKTSFSSQEPYPPPGTEIEIQYLPSWLLTSFDAARPVQAYGWGKLTIFLLAAAGTGYFLYRAIYPPAIAAPAGRRRR